MFRCLNRSVIGAKSETKERLKMDFETAVELLLDRDGSVMFELVLEARDWMVENGHTATLRMILKGEYQAG